MYLQICISGVRSRGNPLMSQRGQSDYREPNVLGFKASWFDQHYQEVGRITNRKLLFNPVKLILCINIQIAIIYKNIQPAYKHTQSNSLIMRINLLFKSLFKSCRPPSRDLTFDLWPPQGLFCCSFFLQGVGFVSKVTRAVKKMICRRAASLHATHTHTQDHTHKHTRSHTRLVYVCLSSVESAGFNSLWQ